MIKVEPFSDDYGYGVRIFDTETTARPLTMSMAEAETIKYSLEAILYEYDAMIDANTNRNYPEDA